MKLRTKCVVLAVLPVVALLLMPANSSHADSRNNFLALVFCLMLGGVVMAQTSVGSDEKTTGSEAYTLDVAAKGITITGADADGVFYGIQSLLYQAAWRIGAGKPARIEAAMCHAYTRDQCGAITRHGHQIHGAMGFTAEYPLQLFTRRAKAYQVTLGSAASHRRSPS